MTDSNDDLKDQNFINLVDFYRDELMLVLKGRKVSKIFSSNERTKLRDAKILSFMNGSYFLSQNVKDMLK